MRLVRACRVAFDLGAHVGPRIPDDAPLHSDEAWTFVLGVALMRGFGGLVWND